MASFNCRGHSPRPGHLQFLDLPQESHKNKPHWSHCGFTSGTGFPIVPKRKQRSKSRILSQRQGNGFSSCSLAKTMNSRMVLSRTTKSQGETRHKFSAFLIIPLAFVCFSLYVCNPWEKNHHSMPMWKEIDLACLCPALAAKISLHPESAASNPKCSRLMAYPSWLWP